MEQKNIKVLDKHGRELSPCCEKIAWVLVNRKRAVKISDTCIKIVIDKHDVKRLKQQAIERDGRVCMYCGRYIPENEKPTVDHLKPKHIFKDGDVGYDSLDNFGCSCEKCNAHKGVKSFDEYVSLRVSFITSLYAVRSHRNMKTIYSYLTNLEV